MRRDIAARFVVIWTLLTRIPLPQKWWPGTMPPGNRVLTLAPAAGGLMGLLTGLVVTVAGFFGLAPLACAWAGAAFYFVIGWALHLDGWGDVWDGIGSGRSGDKLREVMKDSRLGSFGGLVRRRVARNRLRALDGAALVRRARRKALRLRHRGRCGALRGERRGLLRALPVGERHGERLGRRLYALRPFQRARRARDFPSLRPRAASGMRGGGGAHGLRGG